MVDGQVVKLKKAKSFALKTVKGGQLFLQGPEFVLTVSCADASGNVEVVVAEPEFRG